MRYAQLKDIFLKPSQPSGPIIEKSGTYLIALPIKISGRVSKTIVNADYVPEWVSVDGRPIGRVRFEMKEGEIEETVEISIEGILGMFDKGMTQAVSWVENVSMVEFGEEECCYFLDGMSLEVGSPIHLVDFDLSSLTVIYGNGK